MEVDIQSTVTIIEVEESKLLHLTNGRISKYKINFDNISSLRDQTWWFSRGKRIPESSEELTTEVRSGPWYPALPDPDLFHPYEKYFILDTKTRQINTRRKFQGMNEPYEDPQFHNISERDMKVLFSESISMFENVKLYRWTGDRSRLIVTMGSVMTTLIPTQFGYNFTDVHFFPGLRDIDLPDLEEITIDEIDQRLGLDNGETTTIKIVSTTPLISKRAEKELKRGNVVFTGLMFARRIEDEYDDSISFNQLFFSNPSPGRHVYIDLEEEKDSDFEFYLGQNYSFSDTHLMTLCRIANRHDEIMREIHDNNPNRGDLEWSYPIPDSQQGPEEDTEWVEMPESEWNVLRQESDNVDSTRLSFAQLRMDDERTESNSDEERW